MVHGGGVCVEVELKIPLGMLTVCSGFDLVSWPRALEFLVVFATDDSTKQLAADPSLFLELQAAM